MSCPGAGLLKVRERGSKSSICSQAQIKMWQAQLVREGEKLDKKFKNLFFSDCVLSVGPV